MSAATMSKKNKGKKAADPNETSKLLAAKISQLEQDAAGEKDQEVEIGTPSIYCVMGLGFRLRGCWRTKLTDIHRARSQEGHQGLEPTAYEH